MNNEKKGQVRKCPACGEIIPLLIGVCPICGHTFDLSKTDVVLIEKLEKDCQGLSRIKNSGMPILIALNIIYIGIAILFVIMDIDDLGIAIFGIFFFGNASLGWIFPMFANQDDKETGKLSSSKLDNYVFNIRSKIKSTKLVYANNPLIMSRLMDLEEYVKENLAARKKRAKMIIGIGVIVAVVLPIIGILMDL
ncbi:MAG: hypothetical protein IKA26_04475 [Alistipes sp.]|nr:hypothetical protein [Alistipes sp.]